MRLLKHALVPVSVMAIAISGICLSGCAATSGSGSDSPSESVTESVDRTAVHEASVKFVMTHDEHLNEEQAETVVKGWESAGHGHDGVLDQSLTVAPPSGRGVPEYESISGTFTSSDEDDADSCVHVLWSREPGEGKLIVYVEEG